MPPKAKFDPTDPAVAAQIAQFQSIGLSEAKATDVARNPKNASTLSELIQNNDLATKNIDAKRGALLTTLAVSGGQLGQAEKTYATAAIVDGRLKTTEQVAAAVKYLGAHPRDVNVTDFDEQCGVGFSITPEELKLRVKERMTSSGVKGWQDLSGILGALRTSPALCWASPLEVKTAVETLFTELFGVKEAVTKAPKVPAKPPKESKKVEAAEADEQVEVPSMKSIFESGFLGNLHKPGGNEQEDPKLMEAHLKATGGKVMTRFPPEPNGFLHIGHSKAIFVDFGYAAHHDGHCYLRYDDTNPAKEEGVFFETILETVRWLGYEPWKITYTSDYFQELYELAVELIKRDKGYVCHCTAEQVKENRGEGTGAARVACEHRSRPVEESLAEFEKMKRGEYKQGEAILRMKQDLEDGNPQMWDLPAYRMVDHPHHRTGATWKMYPTYDFAHCLVDSIENISHSLCTLEFRQSRKSYEWLCDAVGIYKPAQREFGRLNLQGTVMSKRKLAELVELGLVMGWDDPRLYTLVALRRRGVPPSAIISFVGTLGVSTAITNIQISRFEQIVRQELEQSAPRLLMVLNPLKVTIENLPEDYVSMIEKPLHPKNTALGSTTIPFTRTIYIEQDDFRLQDSKDYFRLAPGKTVGLFQAPFPITCTSYKTDESGQVIEVICKAENGTDGKAVKKPKAYIQWVAKHAPSGSPVVVDETRIFYQLFKSDDPSSVKPNFKADINPNSMEVVKNSMIEIGFWTLAKRNFIAARAESKARTEKALETEQSVSASDSDTPRPTSEQLVGNECVRFQALRIAYFALDKDAKLRCVDEEENVTPGRREGDVVVLNRLVTLKEDSAKNS